jgi:two-component system, LytTR family, sensor kinase
MQAVAPNTNRWRRIFRRRYLFHLLFWIMYAVFMLLELEYPARKKGFLFVVPQLAIYFALMAMLVYVNILLLIPVLLKRKKIVIYIIGLILLIVFYTYFRSLNQQYWESVMWPDEKMLLRSYYRGAFLYAIWFLIISSMLYFTQQWWAQQQRLQHIEVDQLTTELKYLRSQLNPHFLFNGLNTIYGNIDIRDQVARDTLLQFSDLLRYSLYEADTDYIDLSKEVRHLENYVALQKARHNTNLKVQLDIVVERNDIQVAPLLFVPFVENAFKFGSGEDNRENYIDIRLQQSGRRITFDCTNSYEPLEPGSSNTNGGGIGLINVKRRLDLLYRGRHQLKITDDGKNYHVELIIEL